MTYAFDYHGDFTLDMTDIWIEQTDPENMNNEVCTGVFTETVSGPILSGIIVEDAGQAVYYPRERAINFLGWDAVCRVESMAYENTPEPSPDYMGDAYDAARERVLAGDV